MGENEAKRERAPVVGFGPEDLVFVRLKRVDERNQSLEAAKAERRAQTQKQLNFASAMLRQGRHVVLLGTNFSRTFVEAVLQVTDRPGRLCHAFMTSDRGGRTVCAYALNTRLDLDYEELVDYIRAYEELSVTAAEKRQHVSDLIAAFNKEHIKTA